MDRQRGDLDLGEGQTCADPTLAMIFSRYYHDFSRYYSNGNGGIL